MTFTPNSTGAPFLVGYPPHSSRAYFSDLLAWHAWCTAAGVHPLTARRHHVDVWVRHLSQEPQPATGRPASPASIARRLSCLSQFYDYGIKAPSCLSTRPCRTSAGRRSPMTRQRSA
jgi:site-specific recombinase XerD